MMSTSAWNSSPARLCASAGPLGGFASLIERYASIGRGELSRVGRQFHAVRALARHDGGGAFRRLPDPATRRARRAEPRRPPAQMIELIGMLQEKTAGNLDPAEAKLLDDLLYDLRMRFVQAQQAEAHHPRTVIVRITFLGTGTSHGVPMIGVRLRDLPLDRPARQTAAAVDLRRDRRWHGDPGGCRPGPARAGARHDIRRVDAILFTHGHADHILGLDETRRFTAVEQRPMPCYGDAATLDDIRQTFAYVFDPATPKGGGLPQLELIAGRRDRSASAATTIAAGAAVARRAADPGLPLRQHSPT